MATFDVLNPETKVFGHYFLEASAGTGKTFAIENTLPRLLLESETPVRISEILVVTFTRAATRELKSRIYQNLLKIKTALETGEGGPLYIRRFLEAEEPLKGQAKRRIEEALCFFETAQIFTLHGFCLKILQEFAFEAQFFLKSLDEEECAQTEKLKEYIKDFLRQGISPDVLSSSQLKRVVQGSGREIEALCEALLHKLEGGQKIHSYPSSLEHLSLWNEALRSLPKASKDELWHDFSLLTKSRGRRNQIELFFSMVEQKQCSFKEWDALLGEKEFFLKELRFASAYKKKPPVLYPFLFEQMQKIFVPLYSRATDYGVLLLSLAEGCRLHYEKGREDLSHFNPDDLVTQLQKGLVKNPSFCEKVRKRYQAVVIDEFQDTDPTQWNIFETLFFKEEHKLSTLYLVGDPKQSIYAFRRADVYLYLRAASLLGDQALAYLNTNFRSHPHLVDALNEFFSFQLPSDWMLLPFLGASLEVRRVLSKPFYPSSLDGDEKGRLHFFVVEDGEVSTKKWPREEIEEDKLFPLIAKEIHSLRKEKRFLFQQMVILVKDRYQAMRLQKALKRYNIPCLMQKSLDVSTSIAYEVMKDLLAAVSRPSSLSALKRFLGGALMGYSSLEIEGSLENAHLAKAKEFFLKAAVTFYNKGLGVFFQNVLLSSSRNDKRTIAEDLLSREDPHLYFDLRQLCQILLENCVEGLYDPKMCLNFLETLRELPQASETLRQCSEEDEDQVQVMTLHKSKGLEFEIVFALGLCSRYTPRDEFISIRKEEGREMASSSQEEEALLLHLQEIDAEKLRQLYVAFTRGKERVYVPLVISKDPHEVQKGAAAPIELLLGGIGLKEYAFDTVYDNLSTLSLQAVLKYLSALQKEAPVSYEIIKEVIVEKIEENPSIALIAPRPSSIKTVDRFLFSFSSLIEGKKEEGEKIYLEPPKEGDLPLGSETGTVIHSILEELCKADLHRSLENGGQTIIERFTKGSCLEGKEEVLFNLIAESVKVPLQEGLCSLENIASKDMQTEMEFLYPFRSSFLKGFIDLVFRYQGRYYILDWKTNYLGPNREDYSEGNIEECMKQSGYFLQAAIYTAALKKYLALFEKQKFESIFGGVVYFFLRGVKPYLFQPDLKGDFPWKST
jgi:exodeoxyribonuclease V beta subunit